MHILAYCYHWPPESLWKMPRREREMWVEMVRTQKEAEAKAVNKDDSTSIPSYAES